MPDRLRPLSNPDTIVGRTQHQLLLAEPPSAMHLVEFTNFMNNAAALEKFLKLLQGFAQLGMSVFASAQLVETSTLLRKHFALGRRYFRVFKWIDCALAASAALCGDANGGKEGVLAMLNVAKWSYLGMFLFTEALTLLDAMDLKKFEWAPMIFAEAMRFWFYSISCGLILIGYDLFLNRSDIAHLEKECEVNKNLPDDPKKITTNGKPKENGEYNFKDQGQEQQTEMPRADPASTLIKLSASRKQLEQAKARRGFLLRQLVANACDLLTPGSIVRYTPMPPAVVAITSIVSSSISSQDLWRSINST